MKKVFPVVDMIKTGQNLKKIVQDKGLSVKDVQNFLGLETLQSVYHWFEGRSMPTLDHLYALSELFCMPVDALLAGNRTYAPAVHWTSQCGRLYAYYGRIKELQPCGNYKE